MENNSMIYSSLEQANTGGDTAVLVFTRSLEEESRVKSKQLKVEKNDFSSLYYGLLEQTVKTVNAVQLPTFIIDTHLQEGNGFGERISNAIQSVFDKGYQKLLVIGTDCPQLGANHLQQAIRGLENGNPVLGPDLRGGVYLFGLQKSQFDFQIFKNLPWQKDNLANSLEALLDIDVTLEPIRDINTAKDLLAVRYSVRDSLKELFFNILNKSIAKIKSLIQNDFLQNFYHHQQIVSRGPPQYS